MCSVSCKSKPFKLACHATTVCFHSHRTMRQCTRVCVCECSLVCTVSCTGCWWEIKSCLFERLRDEARSMTCFGCTYGWTVWVRTGYPVSLGIECEHLARICKGLTGCLPDSFESITFCIWLSCVVSAEVNLASTAQTEKRWFGVCTWLCMLTTSCACYLFDNCGEGVLVKKRHLGEGVRVCFEVCVSKAVFKTPHTDHPWYRSVVKGCYFVFQ